MTNDTKKRYTAEDMRSMADLIELPGMGYHGVARALRQAANTDAQVAWLVERIESIAKSWQITANNDFKDDYSFGRMQVASLVIEELREALSKFRGEDA